jgi:DNA-binding MarR family transcriptional regulator
LVRIHQKVDKASEKNFHALGLNTAWFDVLARVGAREGLSQGELAESLLVTKGNVSQLVAKMEAGGLVERRADGRSQRLWLTAGGRTLHDRAVPQQEALLAESLGPLTAAEQADLIRLLRKWEKP